MFNTVLKASLQKCNIPMDFCKLLADYFSRQSGNVWDSIENFKALHGRYKNNLCTYHTNKGPPQLSICWRVCSIQISLISHLRMQENQRRKKLPSVLRGCLRRRRVYNSLDSNIWKINQDRVITFMKRVKIKIASLVSPDNGRAVIKWICFCQMY